MEVKVKTSDPNAEVNIVEIARVSSVRENKSESPEGLINYLIRNKHWSPFEHSTITMEIDTSKAIAIQYLRHVSFRFQEFSQRYAVVSELEPIEFRLQAEKNRQSSTDVIGEVYQGSPDSTNMVFDLDDVYLTNTDSIHVDKMANWLYDVANHLQKSLELYNEGLDLGVARECARMILPMTTKTKMYMTGSIRSWIHLIDVRDDGHAQKEAQEIAKAIKNLLIEKLPIISSARGWYVS